MEGKTIKSYAASIMKQLNVPETVIAVVIKAQTEELFTALLVCALDGMDEGKIRSLIELEVSADQKIEMIATERKKHLSNRFGDTTALCRKIEDLKKKYETAKQELDCQQEKLQEQVNTEKQKMEKRLQGEVKKMQEEYEARIQDLKASRNEAVAAQKALAGLNEILQNKMDELQKEAPDTVEAVHKKEDSENLAPPDEKGNQIPYRKKRGWVEKLICRLERMRQDFPGEFLDSEKFSQEQQEFFVTCYEHGFSAKEIKCCAYEKLTRDMMLRLFLIRNQKIIEEEDFYTK